MSTSLEDVITEQKIYQAKLEPALEGWVDDSNLNLLPPTKVVALEQIEVYRSQLLLTVTAIAANEALLKSVYPNLPVAEIEPAVFIDLKNNSDTILAALKQTKIAPTPEKLGGPIFTQIVPKDS